MVKVRIKYKIFILFAYVITIFQASVYSQNKDTQIKAIVNPKETTIGVNVEYRVSIASSDKNIEIILPEEKIFIPKETKSKKLDKQTATESEDDEAQQEELEKIKQELPLYVIQKVSKEDNSDSNLFYQTVVMQIVFYRTGKYKLPKIIFRDQNKIELEYKIPEITISSINKKGQFEEIEPPLDLKGNYLRIILVVVAAILAGGLIFLCVHFIRKKIKSKKDQVVVLPAKTVFRNEIKKLKKANYLDKGNVERFVFELSMIFRNFLHLSLKFNAVDMTNEEIYCEMKNHLTGDVLLKVMDEMHKLMDLWELSKFAEFTPSNEVLVKNLNDTEKFVLETTWEEKNVRI